MDVSTSSNSHVATLLVSSILSTLSLPRIAVLPPDPPLSPPPPSPPPSPPPPQHSDALCGPCPSSGSVPQPNGLWPSLPSSSGGFPAWPGQLTQLTQPTQPTQFIQPSQPTQPTQFIQPTQPAPCWTGQPNTPCWPGTQPAVSVGAPMTVSVPAQVMAPAPAPAPITTMVPAQVMAPAPAPITTMVPAQAQALPPNSVQSCHPCWPGTQYQPQQTPAPMQVQVPAQTPLPSPVPAPAPSIHPSVPGWAAHPGWPYNPGQSGWPGQNPSLVPLHWLPPTSGPLSVPYNLNLARGVYDKMMMTILGHVKPDGKMFTVNFLRGNDIAFHINPRFNEGGKQVMVRNHKLGERWGSEERDLKGPFPFALGSPFEMKILCSTDSFRVAVNNIPLFEFRHRVRELNRIDRINILHDVVLTYVNVETLP